MKLMIMNLSISTNMIFMFLNHPMSMGISVLIQMTIMSLMMNMFFNINWFSYILFLLFIGGMLILFMYMCSITSNNILLMSPKLVTYFMFTSLMTFMWMFFIMKMNFSWTHSNKMNSIFMKKYIMDSHIPSMLMKLFNDYSYIITLMMMMYLLILMILVNSITNYKQGALRKI
uniref:NADH dehydrogenase subunit 6 n=1 Tax=Gunungiella acanthoclada TaxID=3025504 RepID=UPI002434F746|nr:NADH dehydrogenase subunit 6 [Gunungiella acanthoclada]WEU80060.1 NADH dehydrogenase subunit 6 [Gunungiella acanthoclada]